MLDAWKRAGRFLPRRRAIATLAVLDEQPAIVHYTPSSILEDPAGRQFWYCNGRKRYATCSGVSWCSDDYLASVNVLGNAIHVHRFDREAMKLVAIQILQCGPSMVKPENICFSPDGSLVAITDLSAADVKICRVDPATHEISLDGFALVKDQADRTAHGVAFSRCGRFLAHTTVDVPGLIRVYRVEADSDRIRVTPFQQLANDLYPLVPKGIDFSRDGSRVAICYSPNVTRKRICGPRGRFEIRSFDPRSGIGSERLFVSSGEEGDQGADDIRFLGGDTHVVLTQQGDDSALVVAVDRVTNRIGRETQVLRNPKACLSFPHGAGVSPDGRWVAITSYGDDKIGIYAVRTPLASNPAGA